MTRKNKKISLEETLRKMSGAVADRFHIQNRGYLKKGYSADITVFDPEKISAKGELPERPEGIDHVFINGIHVVEGGIANEPLLKGAGHILANT